MIKELKCSSATVTASYARFRRLIIASLGDLNRCDASYAHNHELLRLNIPKGARKVHYVDHMMVAMWRERHRDNLWGAFMDVLKIVKADDCGGGEGRQTSGMVVDGIMNDGFTLPLEVTADTAIDQDDDLPRTNNTQHSESRKRSHSDISETVLVVMETTALGEGGLFCYMANTEEKAIELLTEYGLLHRPKHVICSHCGYKGLRRKSKQHLKSLKCNRCNKSRSLTTGTFFHHTKVPIQTILQLAAYWLSMTPRQTIVKELKMSSATVTNFFRKFRCIIAPSVDCGNEAELAQACENENIHEHLSLARKISTWREANIDNLWEAFLVALGRCATNETHGEKDYANAVWVDEKRRTACCKYHLKLSYKQKTRERQIRNAAAMFVAAGEVQKQG